LENQNSELENKRNGTYPTNDAFLPSGSELDDVEIIRQALNQPSGSQEKFKKRWIEFDCQNGVHHGKYATYKNKKRIRVEGGYIGRFDAATRLGEYERRRVVEFIHNHNCHYVERFSKDLDECGIRGIEVKSWPSGRGIGRLAGSGRPSGSEERQGE
jgi:hypothetical protein